MDPATGEVSFAVNLGIHDRAVALAPLLAQRFPGVPVTRPLGENEALFSNRKIREVLGFREEHDWRQYVSG